MSIDPNAELARFQQFINDHLGKGETFSPEEALDLWRAENPEEGAEDEELEALREAINEMEAGDRGVSLEEFDKEIRRRHGLSS